MPRESNEGSVSGVTLRVAAVGERGRALRVLLGTDAGGADTFARQAELRGYDLGRMVVAEREGRILWAVLPVDLAGLVQMVIPASTGPMPFPAANAELIRLAERSLTTGTLCQALIDPADAPATAILAEAGYAPMATLQFLTRTIATPYAAPPGPEGLKVLTWAEAGEGVFREAIERSYVGTRDCPGLSGKRSMDEVMRGHRDSGRFTPGAWWVLLEGEAPAGVLLLNEATDRRGLDLVYLGVSPSHRGRGLGDWMVRRALREAYVRKLEDVSLAVDAENAPALRIYHRHGFRRERVRLTMFKRLGGGTS